MPNDHDTPLCVDLDGTLIRTDLAAESALAVLKQNPLNAVRMLAWLARGKAQLKLQLAHRASIDPATLPYDQRVLDWLHTQRHRVRVLVTAANTSQAQAVAAHLGIFDEVLASDADCNLRAGHKANRLVQRFGDGGFDYAGNERNDVPVWANARCAILVNAPSTVTRKAKSISKVVHEFPAHNHTAPVWWRALRPHQWLKNLLLFLPALAAHQTGVQTLAHAALGWLAFSVCASGTYLMNDLLDLQSDRHHPRKCHRGFARGDLSIIHGMIVAPILLLVGFVIALWLPWVFLYSLGTYVLLTVLYSLTLKAIVVLDVLALAMLYTVRIIAGGAATTIPVSWWLIALSVFLFLGLALLKRYAELHDLHSRGRDAAKGRGYLVSHLGLVQIMGIASGVVSIVVLGFYIQFGASAALYAQPTLLWFLCPLLLAWMVRVWLCAWRGQMHDDPLLFAARDPASLAVLALGALILYGAI